jgi:uncharacterized protein YndB with AHSA1/START domain
VTVLSGSSSAEIDAPIARCWKVLEALEEAPNWQAGLERVEVVERDGGGRAVVCDVVFDAKFRKVRVRVRVAYEPPRRLTFTRVASDDVDALESSWELEDLSDHRSRATFRLAVDPGPVPFLARPLVNALRPLVVGNRGEELARAVEAQG